MTFEEGFQTFDIIKVYQDMGPFPGHNLDTGYTEYILKLIDLNGSCYVIMVRDGDADIERLHPPGNFINGILSIRIPTVKMQINHRKLFLQ